jgi:hypothetical protein
MKEDTHRTWDIVLKFVVAIVTVIGLMIGAWQFKKQQADLLDRQYKLSADNERAEFKRRMWEKQLDVYTQMNRLVGRIAAGEQTQAEVMKDIVAFEALYWGENIYVQDSVVEEEMHNMHKDLQGLFLSLKKGDRISEKDKFERAEAIRDRAIRLGQKLKEASKKYWFENAG